MSISQTVDIPASHRLTIDVPREIPAGTVILTFTPGRAEAKPPPPGSVRYSDLIDPNIPTPHTDFLSGILAGTGDITLEQIREERLSKYTR